MDKYQVKRALIVLFFILTVGSMALDRRAPFFLLMGFVLMGTVMCLVSVVYHINQMHTQRHDNVVYIKDRRS